LHTEIRWNKNEDARTSPVVSDQIIIIIIIIIIINLFAIFSSQIADICHAMAGHQKNTKFN